DHLKTTFDSICAINGSTGAVMIRADNGEIIRQSGLQYNSDETFVLSGLMKDAARLVSIVDPNIKSLTRVTISRLNGSSVVATTHQDHVFAVKLATR
ncbi:hypothetical protein EC988_009831, partial [Linderina pennispora]